MLSHARQGEAIAIEYDWVEFTEQYGGFPRPQGYFNIIDSLHGVYALPYERFFEDGIYYVVLDRRARAFETGYIREPERLPEDFTLLEDFSSADYGGPDRWIYRTFTPQKTLDVPFGDVANLLGYDLSVDNEQLSLHLYWHAQRGDLPAYSVFVHLIDPDTDEVVLMADRPPERPTEHWEQYEWVFDLRKIDLADVPAGRYTLSIGMYDPVSGVRLSIPDSPIGRLNLTEIEVK